MKELLLVCAVAAFFLLCFFGVKKLDAFLEKNRRQTDREGTPACLSLAFDNPLVVPALTPILDEFSGENPDCRILISSGTAGEIFESLSSGGVDFGFVSVDGSADMGEYGSVRLVLWQGCLNSDCSGFTIEPLSHDPSDVCAVWQIGKDNCYIKAFSETLERFSQKQEHCVKPIENGAKM